MKHEDPRLFRLPYDPSRAGRKARARKRYAPEGWPHGPLWSDDDMAAAFARRRRHTTALGAIIPYCKDKSCDCHNRLPLPAWKRKIENRIMAELRKGL